MPRQPQDSPHVRDTGTPTPYGGFVTPSSDHHYPGNNGNDDDSDCSSIFGLWIFGALIIIQTIGRFVYHQLQVR